MRRIQPDAEHPVDHVATGCELITNVSQRLPHEAQLLVTQEAAVLEEHQPRVHRNSPREF